MAVFRSSGDSRAAQALRNRRVADGWAAITNLFVNIAPTAFSREALPALHSEGHIRRRPRGSTPRTAFERGGVLLILPICIVFAFLAIPAPPSISADDNKALLEFDRWVQRYKSGEIIFQLTAGRVVANCSVDRFDAGGEFPKLIGALSQNRTQEAARRLLDLASFHFCEDPNVEIEQFADRSPARVRAAALETLGSIHSREVLDYLAGDVLLETKNTPPEKRAVAARALGFAKDKQIRLAIFSAARDPSPLVRGAAIESAVALGGVAPGTMRRWLDETDPEVRLVALEAVARAITTVTDMNDRRAILNSATALLDDADPRARDRAVEILVNAPDRDSIPLLIDFMAAERNRLARGKGRLRLLLKSGEALQKITGLEFGARDHKRWSEWWQSAGEKYQLTNHVVGIPKTLADGIHYFDVAIRSDRIIFIIDSSASMAEPAPPPTRGREYPPARPANPKQWTKLDRAKNELLRVVHELDSMTSIQIITCATRAETVFDALTPATKENKSAVETFIMKLKAEGETSLYEGISRALSLTFSTDRKSGRDGDTIFLLSDGIPTTGAAIDELDILCRVRDQNRLGHAEFYTLYFGEERGPGKRLLETLARENRGEFRNITEK